MRIRISGKHARREDTIEHAAEFWDCNKTRALMQSAEFAWRTDDRIRRVVDRDDLTLRQKREIAEVLTIPSTYEVEIADSISIEKQ